MDARPEFPYLFAVLELWFAEGFCGGCGVRPRSSPPAQGSSRRAPSCAPTGEPTLSGAPLSPCFAAESAREGTLMSLPEGAPARSGRGTESGYSKYTFGKRGHPLSQRGKAVSSVVTSGCPKRSEGGCPCRNEDDNRLSKRSKAEHCLFKRNRASPAEPSTPVFPSGS